MTNLVGNLENLADPPIQALIVTAANPTVSNPDSDGVRRALSRPDLFTVAIDIFHTETTAFADIILPSTMQHEQHEMNDSFSHLYLHWNEKAVEPPGECRSHTQIFADLATALASQDPAFSDPQFQVDELDLAEALLDSPEMRAAGITLEALRRTGFARLPGTSRPFAALCRSVSHAFGSVRVRQRPSRGRWVRFAPEYRGAKERKNDAPFMLIANGSDWHINSTFAGTSKTLGRAAEPRVVIHPNDASDVLDGWRRGEDPQRARFVPSSPEDLRCRHSTGRGRHHQGVVEAEPQRHGARRGL